MQILQIGNSWFPENPGGLDRYFYDCVQYLPKYNVDVKGLVIGSTEVLSSSHSIVKAFAKPQTSLVNRWLGISYFVGQFLASSDNDCLVVSHFSLYTFPILTQLRGKPLLIHFHGPWALESKAEGSNPLSVHLKFWIEKACYRRANSFVVLSEAFKKILHESYDVDPRKIHVIPGGVDSRFLQLNISKREAREHLSWGDDRPIILAVRRLANRMGLENLLEAISMVKQNHPEVLLYIAGKGALRDKLEEQIQELKLEDNVKLLGYVSEADLPSMYRAADFSIVPTVSFEGFGLCVVESLAVGTPAIGTPVGGIPEILKPFSHNLLTEGSEPMHLAKAISEILSGERILPTSDACKAYAKGNFDWSIIAQKLKSVYLKALEGYA